MKKHLTLLLLTLLVGVVNAQVSKSINVATPGTLYSYVTENEKATITNLTVSGNINYTDFYTMTSMPLLNILDLSGATINAYTEQGGYYRSFAANALPDNSFDNTVAKPSQIKLPNNLLSIGGESFYSDTNLESITIPASVIDIGPLAFNYCSKLKKVIFLGTTPPTLGTSVIRIVFAPVGNMSNLPSIYVPIGCVNTFESTTDKDMWKQFDIYESILTTKTQNSTNITLSSATLNGSIEFIYSAVNTYGFCWNTTGSPTISDSKIDKGATTTLGAYDYTVTNLQPSTTYYVRAYAADGTGTVYGNEISFTTASIPTVAGTISGLQTVCQGQNAVTYTVPTVANATSYIWTLPTGVTGISSTNSITVNYAKTFTSGNISVKGHNDFGDGTASTIAITANLLPVNAGTISGRTSVCQGETSVNYTVHTIDNATSYSWTLPTGATGTSTTNSINVNYGTSAVSGNITVKGHNDCGDGIVSSLPITINQLPVISVTDKTVICGGSVSLNATTNYSGNGTLTYLWSPTTGLNDATIANPTATITSDITYTVTVTTPNGCTTTKNVSIKIIPMSKPQIGIVSVNSSNKNIVVWNKPVTIGIDSYSIYRETTVSDVYEKIGTVPYSDLSVFVDNLSTPDVKSNKYKILILDKSGQESALSDPHKTMHLSINKGQNNTWNLIWEPYIGFTPSTYNIYRGSSATSLSFIDATSGSSTQYSDVSAPSGDVYYQLEVISPTLVTPSQVKSTLQKIKDSENIVTVSYNSSRSNVASNITSGINELNAESNNIHVYPNPVKDQLKIDFIGGSTFEILNLMGQNVYTGNLNNSNIVQTSNFSSGVYLIKFNAGKSLEYKKFIKN